jgi:hypothetical protein
MRLWDHLHYMCYMDDIFAQVHSVMDANPRVREIGGGIFPDWIERAYAWTILAGLRVMVDKNSSVSLVRLQYAMEEMAAVALTRERFLTLWAHDTKRGGRIFDGWAGKGESSYPSRRIKQDREKLLADFKEVEKFANENVTHIAMDTRAPAPNYTEIRAALKKAFLLMDRYTCLLVGDQRRSPVPVIQRPWQGVFQLPWVPQGELIPSYLHLDKFNPRGGRLSIGRSQSMQGRRRK